MSEKKSDGLLARTACKSITDRITPELQAESTDLGRRDGVSYAGDLEIESADDDVGRLNVGRDECAKGGGGRVVLPLLVFSDGEKWGRWG